MKLRTVIALAVSVAGVVSGQSIPIRDAEGLLLKTPVLVAENDAARLQGAVQNQSPEKWFGVWLDMTAVLNCPSNVPGFPRARTISFRSLVGDVEAGQETRFRDIVISAVSAMREGCSLDKFTSVSLAGGMRQSEVKQRQAEADSRANAEFRRRCRVLYLIGVNRPASPVNNEDSEAVTACKLADAYRP